MNYLKALLFLFAMAFTITTFQSCKDPCDDIVCKNGGTCDEGDCNCVVGFSGARCENNYNSFTTGDNTYLITQGFIEEMGSNGNGSFNFDVFLVSPSGIESYGLLFGTADVVSLDLTSNSENGLVDGTYIYDKTGERELFELADSYFTLGFNFNSNAGEIVGVTEGTVDVKLDGDNVIIDFNLQSNWGDLVGNYTGPLKTL